MTNVWMPGAQKLDIGDHAPTDSQYPPKAIAHITWDKNASASKPVNLVPFENLRSYFSGGGKAVAPHILWDPFTGKIVQFVPANSRSKSVVDLAGGTRTNRAGKVVIQVEALFFPYCRVDGKVYAKLSETPCKGWDELNAWIRDLGVPDVWPMGRPKDFAPHRSEHTWETEGGWYGHSQVPENTHQDPGSWPAFVDATKPPVTPKPTPTPAPKPAPKPKPVVDLSNVIYAAKHDPDLPQGHTTHAADVRIVEAALKAEGLLTAAYSTDGSFGSATVHAYAMWQERSRVGKPYDGIPGIKSLTKLGTAHGFTVKA